MLGALLIVRWLPSPAGVILSFAVIFVGLPLSIMVASDLMRLREQRMLARRMQIFPPSVDEPAGYVRIEYGPLALEHVGRWR
jgi:hypothetical protein